MNLVVATEACMVCKWAVRILLKYFLVLFSHTTFLNRKLTNFVLVKFNQTKENFEYKKDGNSQSGTKSFSKTIQVGHG